MVKIPKTFVIPSESLVSCELLKDIFHASKFVSYMLHSNQLSWNTLSEAINPFRTGVNQSSERLSFLNHTRLVSVV